MKKCILLIAVMLCLGAVLGAATAAVAGEKEVVVVNTPSQSVPVAITSTPVPVTFGAKEPIARHASCDAAAFGACGTNIMAVPAGKRFVAEYFSCNGNLTPGQVLTCRLTVSGSGIFAPILIPTTTPAPAGGFELAQMSSGQSVRLYAGADTDINGSAWVSGPITANVPHIEFTVVGYLEDAP